MALNFQGLGYSFGAKDDGLRKMQSDIHQGFVDINTEVDKFTKKAKKAEKEGSVFSKSLCDDKTISKTTSAYGKASDMIGKTFAGAMKGAGAVVKKVSGQMTKDSKKGTKGFEAMGEAVQTLKKILGQARLQTLIQAMGLDKIQDAVSGIHGSIKSLNLSDAIEDRMVGMGKSARAMGANFGYTGKELSQFSGKAASMADSLNIGVDTTASALRAWKEAETELRMLGFKSAADVAKFADAYGVSADTLRNQAMRMSRELGLGEEEIKGIMGAVTAFGQASGDVNKALESTPELLDTIAKRRAMGDSAKDAARFAMETQALGAALFNVTQDSDKAREMAMQFATQMTEAKDDFKGMFAGTKTELHGFFKEMGIGTGDLAIGFESMQQGPLEFAQGMDAMIKKAGGWDKLEATNPEKYNMLRQRMGEAFGDQKLADTFIASMRNSSAETDELIQSIMTAQVDMGKMAGEAHRTGRTLSESWDRVGERFEHNFNRIGRPAARAFVRESDKQFTQFNKTLRGVVENGGPLSMLVTKMSEVNQIGSLALVPKTLRPMAALVSQVGEAALPTVGVLGSLGLRMKHVVNPFSLGAVAIGGVVVAMRQMEASYKGGIEQMAKSRKSLRSEQKAVSKLKDKLAEATEGTKEYADLKKQIAEREKKLDQAQGLYTARNLEGDIKRMSSSKKRVKKQENLVAGLQKKLDDEMLSEADRTRLSKQLKEEKYKLDQALNLRTVGSEEEKAALIKGIQEKAANDEKSLQVQIDADAKAAAKQRVKDLTRQAVDTVKAAVMALPEIIKEVVRFVREDLGAIAGELWPALQEMFGVVWDAVTSVREEDVTKVTDWLVGTVTKALEYVGSIDWYGTFTSFFKEAGSFIEAVFMGTGNEETLAGKLGNTFHEIGSAALGVAWDLTKAAAGAWWTRFTEAWRDIEWRGSIGDFLSQIGDAMLDSAAVVGMTVVTAMFFSPGIRKVVTKGLGTLFGGLGKLILSPFAKVGAYLKRSFQEAMPFLRSGVEQACNACSPGMGGYGAGGYGAGGPGGRKRKGGRRKGGRRRGGKLGRVGAMGSRGISAVSRTGRRGLGAVKDIGGKGLGKVKQLGGRGLQKAGAVGRRGMGAAKRGAGALRGKGGLLLGGGMMAWDAYDMMAMGGEMDPADTALQGGLMAVDLAEMADTGAGAFKGATKSMGLAKTAAKGSEAAISSTALAVESTAQTTLQATTRLGKVGTTAMKGLGAAARVGSKALPLIGGLIEGGFAAYNITQRWDEAKNGYEQAALVNEELGMAMVSFGTAGISDLVGFREMVPGMQDSLYGAMESTHEFFSGASSSIKEFTDGWVDLSKGYDIVASVPLMGSLLPELGDFSGTREEKARIRETKRAKMSREGLASSMMAKSRIATATGGEADITKQGAYLHEAVKAMEGMAELSGEMNLLQAKTFGGMRELSDEDKKRLEVLENQKMQYLGIIKATTDLGDHNLATLYHMSDANELRQTGNQLMLDYMKHAEKAGVNTLGLVDSAKAVDEGLFGWGASLTRTNTELAKAEALMAKQAETMRAEREAELQKSFELIGSEQKRYMESVKQYDLLQSVIANEETSEADRIKAQERLMKLRMDLGSQGAGMLQDMEAMVTQGTLTAEQFEQAKKQVEGINEAFALGTKDAEGYGVVVSSIVGPSMDQGMAKANIEDMMRTLEEKGAEAWKKGMVLDEAQVAQAMNFVSGESKQKLEEYATLLEQKRAQHASNMADLMGTLQNQANLNGIALSQEALAHIADNMAPAVDQFRQAVENMEDFQITTPVKVVYKKDEEGNVLKDENGEPIELSVSGGMTWDTDKIMKNRETLQQKWEAGTLETELGLAPVSTEEFLNMLPSVQDDPEAMKKLQDRLGLGMLLDPEQARMAAETFQGTLTAEEMNFDLGTAVQNDLALAEQGMEAFATKATEQLDLVVAKVDEEFGNSQHEVINADFDLALTGVQTFSTKAEEAINNFADALEARFETMWVNALGMTATAYEAITTDVDDLTERLVNVQGTLERVAAAQATLGQKQMAQMLEEVVLPTIGANDDPEQMQLAATHMPLWYSKQAAPQFSQMIALLGQLVDELKRAPAQGGRSRDPNGSAARRLVGSEGTEGTLSRRTNGGGG